MPAASWFLRKTEPDPVMSKRCSAPGTNLSRTMRRDPAGRIMPGHDLSPPGLRRGTIPAFYRKMQEMQRWHAYSQNTPSWLYFFCLCNYSNVLYLAKPCFARMKNFLTSFSQRGGSGGGGYVFARRSSRSLPGSFLSYQELITKRKEGRAAIHFVASGEARRPQKAGTRGGGSRMAAWCRRHGDAVIVWPRARLSAIKKGDRHMTVALVFSGEGRPTGPDPPARGSLPDLPGTCPDVPSGRAR